MAFLSSEFLVPVAFPQTTRSLSRERASYARVGFFWALVLAAAWLYWLCCTETGNYLQSSKALVEVRQGSIALQILQEGRIQEIQMRLGSRVQKDEVLLVLDSSVFQLQLREQQSRHDALQAALEAMLREQSALAKSNRSGTRSEKEALKEARARASEALIAAELAESEAQRDNDLFALGSLTEAEVARSKASARKARAAADSLQVAIGKQRFEIEVKSNDGAAIASRIEVEIARLQADIASQSALIAKTERQILEHSLRAPTAGVISQLPALHIGQNLQGNEVVASLLPDGELQVIAFFAQEKSLGKLHPELSAWFIPNDVGWLNPKRLSVTINRVASEAKDGLLRVECNLPAEETLRHGEQGVLTVEISRASPVRLLLEKLQIWESTP